ncbi:Cyclic dehypoxanthine futalosine synthase [Streptomyces badius]
MEIAHGLGVESTSTMLMGTGETNAERIEHLRMIRDVQDRTGGFRAFIPYTYQPENNKLKGRTQATLFEYLRMIAIARLFLGNVAHIQGSWLTTGKEVGQLSLHYGADDLGSIMLEENVVSSAGAKHRSSNGPGRGAAVRAAGTCPRRGPVPRTGAGSVPVVRRRVTSGPPGGGSPRGRARAGTDREGVGGPGGAGCGTALGLRRHGGGGARHVGGLLRRSGGRGG